MRPLVTLALAAWLVFVGAPSAGADGQPDHADLRCMLVGLASQEAPEAKSSQKSGALALALYYFGRVNARSPAVDIQPMLERELRGMKWDEWNTKISRCRRQAADPATELRRIGNQRPAKDRSPPPARP
jgi:hypothetical protein